MSGYTLGMNGPGGSCEYKYENGAWRATGNTNNLKSGYTCMSPVTPGDGIPTGSEGQTEWVHAQNKSNIIGS